MNALFLVMAGGALGSAGRYLTGRATSTLLGPDWPWGTMTVNLLGGLLMGLLTGALARVAAPEGWRLFVSVGVLGGFTTFSTFSLDAISLYERGEPALAALYVGVSVAGGLLGLLAGMALIRAL